ncbi:hypothetical protein QR680_017786 [Steinernema hermaphroditum]|uniref:Core Histone H2A/H2B/H3 domain-containing protein n=1 Tax=Steinernema hermaphroditum TaxID=289476 RepID=A0AA39HFT2_9BILA|nr:hypothetical protein QR680_017786 [Steinernema hermaphroditum]
MTRNVALMHPKDKKARMSSMKRRKGRKESFNSYIFKILKGVHNNTGISSKAMSIMNSLVNDIFDRIALEAAQLASYSQRSTIAVNEVQSAVRLMMPGELSAHAVAEANKAVARFENEGKR